MEEKRFKAIGFRVDIEEVHHPSRSNTRLPYTPPVRGVRHTNSKRHTGCDLVRLSREGAQVILATVPGSKSIFAVCDGLGPRGSLIVVGADMPLAVTPLQLTGGSKIVRGWASGTARDSQDTLEFSALSGVRPMIECYPLEKAADAYNQMISGRAASALS